MHTAATVFPIPVQSPVFLAPMSGITDVPFRNTVARFGAGLLVSEMIASGELVAARPARRAASLARAGAGNTATLTSVQLAGRDPVALAQAARIAEAEGAPMIDINMGCPAKKVVGGLSGSALMREPDLALRLIDAVLNAVSVPVSVKMRLGWDGDCLNAPDLARRAGDMGVGMITIHGRTRMQFYNGTADWSAIGSVRAATDLPLIANGDIIDLATARQALRASGADGVMVGRGAQGRPWLIAQIAAGLAGMPIPQAPQGVALVDLVSDHYIRMLDFYGVALGHRIARKHLGWYIDAAGGRAETRRALQQMDDPAQVLRLLPEALTPERRAA